MNVCLSTQESAFKYSVTGANVDLLKFTKLRAHHTFGSGWWLGTMLPANRILGLSI